MGEVLSQSEIDELLKALNTGEIDVNQIKTTENEKKIRDYDFRRPNKFAKDHLRTLNIIHEDYARYITNYLTAYLRSRVNIEVLSVEEVSYYEFSNSISNPSILSIVEFIPLNGFILLEMNPSIAFAVIDRILGGRGIGIEKVRGFTEIELAIIERIVNQMLGLMREPWENVVSVKPRLDRIETNSQFAQIISPNEMIALVTLDAQVGDIKGMMNICIPHLIVEPVLPKLSTKYWFTSMEKEMSHETIKNIERKIEYTSIPLKAILGKTNITVEDFLELQKDDVILLDTPVGSDIKVMVGNMHKFNGIPGVRKNRMSIKITEIVRKEEDDI